MQNIQKMEEELEKIKEAEILLQYDGEDKIITSEQAWKNLEEERKTPKIKMMSKIPFLDKCLEGFREGDLVVVSGITKGGKTTFCQTLTHNFAEQKLSCLWFSYEMAQMEFMEKFGEPLPFFTMPSKLKGNSLKWLEERIVESMAKYNTKIVFIDHLHFLLDMSFLGQNKGGNMSLIIGGIMRELKKIALYRGITIVLIAHTAKIKFDAEPSLSDIRDSSFISQEADTVLMIWRNRLIQDQAVLAVLANRRTGRNGTIDLVLENHKFRETEDQATQKTKIPQPKEYQKEIDVNKMFK